MEDFWYHYKTTTAPLFLSQCGHEAYQASTSARHYTVQQKWIIHYILAGEGSLEVNGHHYDLKKDDLFFFFQGQRVKYYPTKKRPWTIIWIGIAGDQLTSFLKQTTLLEQNTASLAPEMTAKLKKTLLAIILSNRDLINEPAPLRELKDTALLYHFLYYLKKSFLLPALVCERPTQKNIIDYINEHYMDNISPLKIAKYFNISYSQLYKLCIAKFNNSPKKIITEHRIRIAVELLLDSDDTIKEIAQKVGYRDEFLFSKTFAKVMGYCPSKFRKLNKKQLKELRFK